MATWPATADELTQLQHALGELTPEPWQPPTTLLRIGACLSASNGSTGPLPVTEASPGPRSRTVAACWPG
jgi:hypothetical protein